MNTPVDVFNEMMRIISLFPDEQYMIEQRKRRLGRKGMSCSKIDSYGIDKDGLEIIGFYRENPVFVEMRVRSFLDPNPKYSWQVKQTGSSRDRVCSDTAINRFVCETDLTLIPEEDIRLALSISKL